jgi:glycosyltransferase involved in cell wall biosynthesis
LSGTTHERFCGSHLYEQHRDRIQFASPQELEEISKDALLVFLDLGPDLTYLSGLRRSLGRKRSPITGVIQSLHSLHTLERFARMLLAELFVHDALICPTMAGRTSVLQLVRLMSSRFATNGFGTPSLPIQLPVIPYGIDVATFAPTPRSIASGAFERHSLGIGQEAVVVLYFGRLSEISKGDLGPLIIAFAALDPRSHDAHLILAGDDSQLHRAGALSQLAEAIGHSDRVHLVPNPDLTRKIALYAAADIFVSPSDNLQETSGLTVVEALAAGLPVIGSDWDGYRDIIQHGRTGLLVRAILPNYSSSATSLRQRDSMMSDDLLCRTTVIDVEQLRDSLLLLICDVPLRSQMGTRGMALAQSQYDRKVIVGSYEVLWDDLVGRAQSARDTDLTRPFLDSQTLPYLDVFGHYGSSVLDGSEVVAFSPLGVDLFGSASLQAFVASTISWLDPALLEEIARQLRSLGPTSCDDLIASVQTLKRTNDKDQLLAHVARLLKYGILRIDSQQSVPTAVEQPSQLRASS